MITKRTPALTVLTGALAVLALAGCGSSASIGGHTITVPSSIAVPSVNLPGLPGIDLSKTDPASARKAVCTATDYWLKADTATKQAVRPAVDQVLSHYKASQDQATRDLATALGALVDADAGSTSAQRSAWTKLCTG